MVCCLFGCCVQFFLLIINDDLQLICDGDSSGTTSGPDMETTMETTMDTTSDSDSDSDSDSGSSDSGSSSGAVCLGNDITKIFLGVMSAIWCKHFA